MSTRTRTLTCLGLLVLLGFMPYATFVLQTGRFLAGRDGTPLSPSLVMLSTAWKEVVLLMLLALLVARSLRHRRLPFSFTTLDWVLLAVLMIGTAWGYLRHPSLEAVAYGFRYDFSPILYFWAARALPMRQEALTKIMRWLVILAIPIAVFAVLQTIALPRDILTRVGYTWGGSSITGNPLPPYHLLDDRIVRAMATFPGPNSLALYVSLLFLAVLFLGRSVCGPRARFLCGSLFLAALGVTFSRAHLTGLLLALGLAYLLWRQVRLIPERPTEEAEPLRRKQVVRRSLAFTGAVLLCATLPVPVITWLSRQDRDSSRIPFAAYLVRPASTGEHARVRQEAIDGVREQPLGHGLGTAGLAVNNVQGNAANSQSGFNPESWYLQMAYELGVVGILSIVALVYALYATLFRLEQLLVETVDRRLWWFFLTGLTAILVAATFLPSWFEVGSLYWWILFGMFYSDVLSSFPVLAGGRRRQ
jgi:hypothetical protein